MTDENKIATGEVAALEQMLAEITAASDKHEQALTMLIEQTTKMMEQIGSRLAFINKLESFFGPLIVVWAVVLCLRAVWESLPVVGPLVGIGVFFGVMCVLVAGE